jgi:hypothetical protein
MKNTAIVIISISLSACASRFTVSCGEKFRADSPAIQERVLAAHPDVKPVEVLKCVAEPTRSGFSTDPDEEACLVWLAPGDVPAISEAQNQQLTAPDAVRMLAALAADLPELGRPIRTNNRGAAVYATANPDQFVLYAPHMRCAVLEEVTQ